MFGPFYFSLFFFDLLFTLMSAWSRSSGSARARNCVSKYRWVEFNEKRGAVDKRNFARDLRTKLSLDK